MKMVDTQAILSIQTSDCALVIIDMLNDFEYEFIDDPIHHTKFVKCANNIKTLSDICRSVSVPVIYINCSHDELQRSPEFQFSPPHAILGTHGARVIDLLEPQPNDIQIGKNTYSGFYGTNLEQILKDVARGSLIFSGLHTHVCVVCTALDAFYRGIRIIVPEECVTTKNDSRHAHGMRFLSTHLGRVPSVDELIKQLKRENA